MGILSGQSGLITGASRGIGKAIALELARNGASVAVGYSVNEQAAMGVVSEIQKLGGRAFPVRGNVADPAQVERAIEATLTGLGKIDFLVNNAGINRDRTLAKLTVEDWNAVIDVNLHSIFNVTVVVMRHMVERGFGRIVNISSVVGQAGNFGQTNYATAKAGMMGFTKSAALEVARKGVTVNCIAPGFVATDMVETMPEDAQQRILGRIPMGRFGLPEEIGKAALFLIAYGDYITGQTIGVNGGLYM